METGRVLTCAYCGMEYPPDTPAYGDKILTDHIKVCIKHPLREAEENIQKLRKALIDLIGAETPDELKAMEATIRLAPAPDMDKTACINAIHALLET